MKNGNLQYSKQLPRALQNGYIDECDLGLDRPQVINKGVSDEHQDREGEGHGLFMIEAPQKKARVERVARKRNERKIGGGQCRQGCSDSAMEESNGSRYITTNGSDNANTRPTTESVSSCQPDASLEHDTPPNSTTITNCLHRNNVESAESIQPSKSFSTATHMDPDDSRCPSVKTEPMPISPDALHDQPDSSTGAYEHAEDLVDVAQQNASSTNTMTDGAVSPYLSTTASHTKGEPTLCQVCGDVAAGFYCQAFICEACKKFFIRASKLRQPKYACLRSKQCAITKESRVHCQYCRYQKCLQLNMAYTKDRQINAIKPGVQEIPCRVCSAPSSGFHFGALTCEGCKGFFRRMVKEREAYSYKCSRNGSCEIKAMTRNMCKACRYNKCLQIGMSVKGSRIGRQPNAVKHALSLEARKRAGMKVDPGNDLEGNTDSSPSHISFDSVILDQFVPGEMGDSLHSIDLIQVSSSADGIRQPLRKLEADPEREPAPGLIERHQQASFISPVDHSFISPVDHYSNIVRHHLPTQSAPLSRDHLMPTPPPRDHQVSTPPSRDHNVLKLPSGDHMLAQTSRDNHISSPLSRDYHVTAPPSRDHHITSPENHNMLIPPSRDHHMPTPPSRDHHMPTPPSRDHSMPTPPSRDHHMPTPPSRDHHMPTPPSRDHHMPTPPSRDHSMPTPPSKDHHMPTPPSRDHNLYPPPHEDHNSRFHHSYTSSLNQSSTSATIHRKFEPQIFGRPHIEVFDSPSDNQPQNLSIDLSKPRTLLTNDRGHTSSQNTFPASGQLSSTSELSPSPAPSQGYINLSSPSTTSLYNYPIDYTHNAQQNVQSPFPIHDFVDQGNNYLRPGYQHVDRYEGNSPVSNMDPHNSHHSSRHIPQRETLVNRMFAPTQSLPNQFPPQFSGHDRPPFIFHEQHRPSFSHHQATEPLQNSDYSRQNLTVETHSATSNGHTEVYANHVQRRDTDLRNFHTRSRQSPEPHNFVVPQDASHFHTSGIPQQSSYSLPHSSTYFTPPTVPKFSFKDSNPVIPRSPQNSETQEPSSSKPGPEKQLDDAGTKNCLNMSNKELHGVLLDAAGNLGHFCAVTRAKSEMFEAVRFQDVDSTWAQMMDHFNFHARCIVRFAKKVPGFRSLKIDDQVLLLRMATYSLVILNHSRAYEPDTGFYNYFNFTKREILMIRELFPEFDVIHIHYKRMGIIAQRDGLTEMEYAYLSCMLIFNNEYSGLENSGRTKELKERYLDAFQDYEIEQFPTGNIRFGKMLQHLSEFSQFNTQHSIAVGLVITKNPQLHIPQLYAEMYTPENSTQGNTDSVGGGNITDVAGGHIEPPGVGTDK